MSAWKTAVVWGSTLDGRYAPVAAVRVPEALTHPETVRYIRSLTLQGPFGSSYPYAVTDSKDVQVRAPSRP